MSEASPISIERINGIIAELQRQNTQLTARCAELAGLLEEASTKTTIQDDVA